MKYVYVIACTLVVLFTACNEVDPKNEDDVRAFVKRWNENHTQLKAPFLQRYYMDRVAYYGKERTKREVAQDKLVLFEQFPDYTQEILDGEMSIIKEDGLYLVVFTKNVKYGGVTEKYESYLSILLKNGDYKIVREGVADDPKNENAIILPKFRETVIAKTRNRQLFGDFNGDGLSDYAYINGPTLLLDTAQSNVSDTTAICKGDCTSVIIFSAPDLSSFTIENAYKSNLENLRDLNGDGADEIGFWNIKPTTKSLYIFDATNSGLLTPPVVVNTAVHKNLKLIDVLKKSGPKKITVTRSANRNGTWVLESEVVVLD